MNNSRKIEGLDSLRIYAMICVIACHTQFWSSQAGGIGNKLFFVMGGFLCFFSLKSLLEECSIKKALTFYRKRVLRIVPAYWLVIILAWIFVPGVFAINDFSSDNSLILNLLFLKAYGHLWFMQQMMLMYLLSPFIMIFLLGIKKVSEVFKMKNHWYIPGAIVLIVLALLEKNYLTEDVLRLSGSGSHQQFQIWMYLFGIAFALIAVEIKNVFKSEVNHWIADAIALAILILLTITVIPGLFGEGNKLVSIFTDGMVRTLLSGLMMILFYNTSGSVFEIIITKAKVLKSVADATFDAYLIHYFLLGFVAIFSAPVQFIIVLPASILYSLLIYYATRSIRKINAKEHNH